MTDKKTMWDFAARAGAALGCVSIAYMLLNGLLTKFCSNGAAVLVGNILSFLLWGFKFYACIALLKAFLMRFHISFPKADLRELKVQGRLIALLSALLYSGFMLAYYLFMAPDTFNDAVLMLQDNPMMTQEALAELDNMLPKMPAISFFVNLIWCYLCGTILTAILAPGISPQNPFAADAGEEEDEDSQTNE